MLDWVQLRLKRDGNLGRGVYTIVTQWVLPFSSLTDYTASPAAPLAEQLKTVDRTVITASRRFLALDRSKKRPLTQ